MARKKIYRKNSSNGLEDTNLVIPTSSDLQKLDGIESGAQKNPKLAAVATSGSYNDLSNKPALAAVATSGSYNSLNDKPALAKVATSGSYGDLINKPNKDDITDLLGFGTLNDYPTWGTITTANGYNIVWGADNYAYGGMVFGVAENNSKTSFQVSGDVYVHDGLDRLLAYSDIANGFNLNSQSNVVWNWNGGDGITFPYDYGGLHWSGQTDGIEQPDGIDLFARGNDPDLLDLMIRLRGDNSSNAIRVLDAQDNNTLTITPFGGITAAGDVQVGGKLTVGGKTVLTDHQSIKTLKTDNTAAQAISASESIAGSGTINLHKVAKTGSYNDLNNKPFIPSVYNGTLTIQKNGSNVASFTANSSNNVTANITVPTKVGDLANDEKYISGKYGGTMTGDLHIANGSMLVFDSTTQFGISGLYIKSARVEFTNGARQAVTTVTAPSSNGPGGWYCIILPYDLYVEWWYGNFVAQGCADGASDKIYCERTSFGSNGSNSSVSFTGKMKLIWIKIW